MSVFATSWTAPRGAAIKFVNTADGQRLRPGPPGMALSPPSTRAVSIVTDDGQTHAINADLAGRSRREVELVLADRLRNPRRSANSVAVATRTPKPRSAAVSRPPVKPPNQTASRPGAANALGANRAAASLAAALAISEHFAAGKAVLASMDSPSSLTKVVNTLVVHERIGRDVPPGLDAERADAVAFCGKSPAVALLFVAQTLDRGTAQHLRPEWQRRFGFMRAHLQSANVTAASVAQAMPLGQLQAVVAGLDAVSTRSTIGKNVAAFASVMGTVCAYRTARESSRAR